jgi:hypothetical protein
MSRKKSGTSAAPRRRRPLWDGSFGGEMVRDPKVLEHYHQSGPFDYALLIEGCLTEPYTCTQDDEATFKEILFFLGQGHLILVCTPERAMQENENPEDFVRFTDSNVVRDVYSIGDFRYFFEGEPDEIRTCDSKEKLRKLTKQLAAGRSIFVKMPEPRTQNPAD